MVEIPKIQRRFSTISDTKSGLSVADILAPHRMLAKSFDDVSGSLEDASVPLAEQAGVASVRKGDDGSLVVDRSPIPMVGKASLVFERAAKQTYLAQATPDLESEATRIRLENPNDPEMVKKVGEEFVNRAAANAEKVGGAVLGQAVRGVAEREVNQNYRSSLVETDRLNTANALVAYKSRLSDLDNKGAALARQGGTGTDEYRQIQSDMTALYGELQGDKRFKFPPERVAQEIEEATSRHRGEAVIGTAMSIYDKATPQSAAEARKFLNDAAYDPRLNLSTAQRQQIVTSGMAALEGRTAENKALVDANKKLVAETIEGLKTDAAYDPRQVNDLLDRAAAIGDAESFYKLSSYRALHDWRQGIKSLPHGQQVAALRQLQGGPMTALADRIIGAESGGNDIARARTSTATGAGQFVDGTWLDVLKRNRPDLAAGKTDAELLALRTDKTLSREMVVRYAEENGRALAAAGLPTHDGALYLAHFLGAGDAIRVLQAPREASVQGLVRRASLDANEKVFARNPTAGQLQEWAAGKVGSRSVGQTYAEAIRVEAVNDFRKRLSPVVEQSIGALETAIGKGRQPTGQEIADIAEGIRITGRTNLVPRVETILGSAALSGQAAGLPAGARDAFRAALQNTAARGDPAVRKVVDAAEETIKANERAMVERPYSTSAARRNLNPPMPLVFDNPQAFATAVGQRNSMDRINREMDGTAARSIFEGQEGEAWKAAMARGDGAMVSGALGALSRLDPEQFQATLADKDFAKGVISASVSPDPAKMNAAMSFLDRAWHSNPTKFNADFGAESAKRLQAWQWMKDTYAPAEIAERMQRLDDPANAAARKSLADAGKAEAAKIGLSGVVAGFKDGWVPFTGPDAPVNVTVRGLDGFAQERLSAEFDEYYVQARESGLPADEAQKAATERLKIAWGPSVGASGALMRHPPEKYYAMVDGSHDWIKGQIDEFLIAADPAGVRNRRITSLDPEGAGAPVDNERRYTFRSLIADRQTEGEIASGVKPSYQIVAVDNRTGKMEVVKGPDGRSRFRFDDSGPKAASEQRILDFNAGVAAMFPVNNTGAF